MRRTSLWVLVGVLVAAVVGVLALPRLLGSERAREELERVLSQALGRPVTIGDVEIASDAPRVELTDVVVGEIEPFLGLGEGGPIASAPRLRFDIGIDQLLDRRLVGTVVGQGITLHVVRKDGALNLAGIGRGGRAPEAEPREPIDLALDVEIEDAEVVFEDLDRGETLSLSGVDVRALLSNHAEDRDARLHVTIEELDLHGVVVHDVLLHGAAGPDGFVVHRLRALIGEQGVVEGKGRLLASAEAGPTFDLDLSAKAIALDGPVVEAAARLFPPLATARESNAGIKGRLDATITLSGAGLAWASVAPTLAGEGEVTLRDVEVPADTLIVRVAALAGRPEAPWLLTQGSAAFAIQSGWVELRRVQTEGQALDPHIRGRVSLAGDLDLTVDLMPMVEAFGGGLYAQASKYTTSIPVRIEGTVEAPKLRPPAPRDIAKGLAGGLLRRALSDPPAEAETKAPP